MNKFINSYFKGLWEENKLDRRNVFLNIVKELACVENYLDLGCHNGSATRRIAEACNAKNVYGVEKDAEFIKESLIKGIKVFNSDLNYELPFKDGFFDLITGDQVIEHLWDVDCFVAEIKRVLKPGGKVVIGTENLSSTHNLVALLFGVQPFSTNISTKYVIGYHPSGIDILNYSKRTEDHKRVFAYNSLKSLFVKYGFKNVKTQSCGFIPFTGFFKRLMNYVDPVHSQFIIVEAVKGVDSVG